MGGDIDKRIILLLRKLRDDEAAPNSIRISAVRVAGSILGTPTSTAATDEDYESLAAYVRSEINGGRRA